MTEITGTTRVLLLTILDDTVHPEHLEATAASVLAQSADTWRWAVVGAGPLVSPGETDPRVLRWPDTRPLRQVGADWVAMLQAGDVLSPRALEECLVAIDETVAAGRAPDYCYTDHDLVDADGRLGAPYHKPDWSPERLLHDPYAQHLGLVRGDVAASARLLHEVTPVPAAHGAVALDLLLHAVDLARDVVHVRRILHHRRSHAVEVDGDIGAALVQEHLDRVGIDAVAAPGSTPGRHVVRRAPDLRTPVSVVIPTRGTSATIWGRPRVMVSEAIRSVRARSRHEDLEFVVVHDTDTPAVAMDELRSVAADLDGVLLVEYDRPFNFSEKCNLGALHATNDVLVFLNDDMEAASDGLVEQLIAPLREPSVGMTGARLLFEDGSIQHGGVSYGGGRLEMMYRGESGTAPGVQDELMVNREVTALTGACMAVSRGTFLEVGGFSESFPMNYNDVDLSLKVGRLGLRLLWLHDCVLWHFESITRDPTTHPEERARLRRRWGHPGAVRERYSARTQ